MDPWLFHWLYGWLRQPPWAWVMEWITHLGDAKVVLSLAAFGILESLFRKAHREKGFILVWSGVPVAAFLSGWLKGIIGRQRPGELFPGVGLLPGEAGRSFPSGHAAMAFALGAALSRRWPQYRLGWYGLAACVALSRVALGLHWVSDVVAGALIGWGSVNSLVWIGRRRWKGRCFALCGSLAYFLLSVF